MSHQEEERLMISAKTAKAHNIIFIADVAERSGMSDREIMLELFNRGYKSNGDDENDQEAIVSILIESYKQELIVHAKVNNDHNLLNQLGLK